MARTVAPLFGFEAQGAVAKSIVYATWRGIKYARRYTTPANPNTAAQQTTRTTFATLREMWKLNGELGRASWEAFAQGRQFLGLNAFIGENMRVVRGEADFQAFVGSPGAKGGLPAAATLIATGTVSGSVDVTLTNPTIPEGWAFSGAQAVAFPDQDPSDDFVGPLVENDSAVADTLFTLGGLGSGVTCICAAWLEWIKPNGQLAYSVGVTEQVASAA